MMRAELVGGPFDGTVVYLPRGAAFYEVPVPTTQALPAVAETEPLPHFPRRAIYRRRVDYGRGPVRFDHESIR